MCVRFFFHLNVQQKWAVLIDSKRGKKRGREREGGIDESAQVIVEKRLPKRGGVGWRWHGIYIITMDTLTTAMFKNMQSIPERGLSSLTKFMGRSMTGPGDP